MRDLVQLSFLLMGMLVSLRGNARFLCWERIPKLVLLTLMNRGKGNGKAYFLPKSAGISPHCLVSHFMILVV